MHNTILLRRFVYLHLVVLFIFFAGPLAAQTEERLLDDINQLPEAERQARLVNGAKKEGSVTWYVEMRNFRRNLKANQEEVKNAQHDSSSKVCLLASCSPVHFLRGTTRSPDRREASRRHQSIARSGAASAACQWRKERGERHVVCGDAEFPSESESEPRGSQKCTTRFFFEGLFTCIL